jgi:excisionase family DNA binding protein
MDRQHHTTTPMAASTTERKRSMTTNTVQLLTVIEVAEHLSRSKVYELLADGTLPSVRIGRNRRVTACALSDFVTKHEEVGISVSATEVTAASA